MSIFSEREGKMGKKEKKPKRSLAKNEEVSWWDEEVSAEDMRAAGVWIAKWNPISAPFTALYYYVAWIFKQIHKASKNFIDRNVRWYWKASLVSLFLLKIIYIIVPIDLIPDFIPYLGYLDDLAVVKAFLMLVHVFNRIADKSIEEVKKGGLLMERR